MHPHYPHLFHQKQKRHLTVPLNLVTVLPCSLALTALDGSTNVYCFGEIAWLASCVSQEKLKAPPMVLGRSLGITKKWGWSVMTALTSNILASEVVSAPL